MRSEQIIDNSKREASISQLTTIFEESEKETETRHTATYDDRNKEASTITTKNENNKQMKFGTGFVNGRKISSIFDSWYIMNNNYRNLPASDELQSRDERKIVAQLW